MKDGFIENNAGNHRLDNVGEAIELNEALEKNFQDHKKDDYKKFIENSSIPHKDYPKKAPVPLNRYQQFKEKQKKDLEEKEFNKKFEQEYGDRAIEKDIRAKEMANRRAGKFPYENFTTSELIVSEHAKDRSKQILKSLKNPVVKDKDVEDISRQISLMEQSRKQTEAEQVKAKREYDAVMNQPKDDDTDKGLGSILGIWKRWWQILINIEI